MSVEEWGEDLEEIEETPVSAAKPKKSKPKGPPIVQRYRERYRDISRNPVSMAHDVLDHSKLFRILYEVKALGSASAPAIVERTGIAEATVKYNIYRLVAAGLLEETFGLKLDRKHYRLTKLGEDVLKEALPLLEERLIRLTMVRRGTEEWKALVGPYWQSDDPMWDNVILLRHPEAVQMLRVYVGERRAEALLRQWGYKFEKHRRPHWEKNLGLASPRDQKRLLPLVRELHPSVAEGGSEEEW